MPKYNVEVPRNVFPCPHCGQYISNQVISRHLAAKGGRTGDHTHKVPRCHCPECGAFSVAGKPCKRCSFLTALADMNLRAENPGLWE